jgi:D-tyrosyl-tRNA(Tyr) deacylase
MRALVQRVSEAGVSVGGEEIAAIEGGLLVLVGVEQGDGHEQVEFLARKIANLRVFEDGDGKMNLSVVDTGGSVLAVSQFTLCADVSRGNRPGFSYAAPPDVAEPLVAKFAEAVAGHGVPVQTGQFQAHMEVRLVNDGPVTIWYDTNAK